MNLRWLSFAVHGRAPRRAARKARRTSVARCDRFMDWMRTFSCLACGRRPVEAAHTGPDGGKGLKASDLTAAPLCCVCHRLGLFAYHNIGKRAFEQRHGLCFADAVLELNFQYQVEMVGRVA